VVDVQAKEDPGSGNCGCCDLKIILMECAPPPKISKLHQCLEGLVVLHKTIHDGHVVGFYYCEICRTSDICHLLPPSRFIRSVSLDCYFDHYNINYIT
jgi:hypothetical protein